MIVKKTQEKTQSLLRARQASSSQLAAVGIPVGRAGNRRSALDWLSPS